MKRRTHKTVDVVSLTESEFVVDDDNELFVEARPGLRYGGNRWRLVNRRVWVPLSQYIKPEKEQK